MVRNGLGKLLPPEAVSHELTIPPTNSQRLPPHSLTKFANVAPIASIVALAFQRSLPL